MKHFSTPKNPWVPKFQPGPARMEQRVWSNETVHEQVQSAFMTRLPAEARNMIFFWVFSGGGSVEEMDRDLEMALELSRPLTDAELEKRAEVGTASKQSTQKTQQSSNEIGAHSREYTPDLTLERSARPTKARPLSLLLTCRKINQEATLLAFSIYTFTARQTATSFHFFRYQCSFLSPCQISAISSLAFDLSEANTYYYHHGDRSIVNSLLLFPNLRNIEIRLKRDGRAERSRVHFDEQTDTECPIRVSMWFWTTIQNVFNSRSCCWQTGEKWSVSWPQESRAITSVIDDLFSARDRAAAADAMKDVDDISPCACGCGAPSWLSAMLVQETGRKVRLQVRYYGDAELTRLLHLQRVYERREMEQYRRLVREKNILELVPGTQPLELRHSDGGEGEGFGWDGDDEFWGRLRTERWGALGDDWGKEFLKAREGKKVDGWSGWFGRW